MTRSKPVAFTEPDWEEKEAERISRLPFFANHHWPSRNQCTGQIARLTSRYLNAHAGTEWGEANYKAQQVMSRAIAIHKERTEK